MPREILTTNDAAQDLDMSVSGVRKLADQGVLPFMRTRKGQRLFWADDVARVLRERKAKAKAKKKRPATKKKKPTPLFTDLSV